jgi:predicted nucleic acid-binding Zn ribbon protein
MGRGLATFGSVLLLLTLALWIGDAVGALPAADVASWSGITLKAGAALLAAGLLLRVVSPVRHKLVHGRCAVCGHPVERGHTYCRDHLQATVNTYRDQTRDHLMRSDKSHSSSS